MTGFYVRRTIIYFIYNYIEKKFNPGSAGDFACSAGELEIESKSLQPKAGDLTSMLFSGGLHVCSDAD